jgi:hypothetical protein
LLAALDLDSRDLHRLRGMDPTADFAVRQVESKNDGMAEIVAQAQILVSPDDRRVEAERREARRLGIEVPAVGMALDDRQTRAQSQLVD